MKKIHHSPSPNFGRRPLGVPIDAVILHGSAGTDRGDLAWLQKSKADHEEDYREAMERYREAVARGEKPTKPTLGQPVSYHYLIWRDGTIHQLVKEEDRAWHAGQSRLYDRENCNDFSIGVAFSMKPNEYVTDAQYDSAAWLLADIWKRRDIDFSRIAEHRAVSPGRKFDCWDRLDVLRLFREVANYRFPPPDPIKLELPKAA